MMSRLIQRLTKLLARLTIAKFKPKIIGVTGSVGKTSTKEAIYTLLATTKRVRRTAGNFNGELGLPLTIVGDWSEEQLRPIARDSKHISRFVKGLFFLRIFCIAAARLVLPRSWQTFPEVIVLEYGADKPGDLAYLTSIARPDISVVTAVGDIPVHVQFYESVESVTREKSHLIEVLPPEGTAVLNADDSRVFAMREKTKASCMTYGFAGAALMRISDFENQYVTTATGASKPTGALFKLNYGGASVAVRLNNTAGTSQVYAAAAAACVAVASGLSLEQAAAGLAQYVPPPHRLHFLDGKGGVMLVDDSYNASPLSMASAIAAVKDLPAKRKVAILGDMRELGKFSEQAHQQIGEMARGVFDVIIAVGEESKVMKADQWFSDAVSALEPVKQLVRSGDLVLVKASHSIGLDKIARALLP